MAGLSFDVVIIGGGPGGSATALSLRNTKPSLSILLIEASHYERAAAGETLPPPTRAILEHLRVWETYTNQHHREIYSTTALWGSDYPLDNDFIYMTANTGWLLDRARFDAMLASEAESRGAAVMLDARVREANAIDDGWQLKLSTGATVSARFIVDASGGAAIFARSRGAYFVDADRLISVARSFDSDLDVIGPRVLVEAFANGWWYTAGLADGRRIVACMTDADLARQMNLSDAAEWNRVLADSSRAGAMIQLERPRGPVVVRSTASRRLNCPVGRAWLAVGDSASRFDPLSSQGITKALRSGIFASYAIGDWLTQGDEAGLNRYRRFVEAEFRSYSEVRTKYYRQEQRWPTSEFWRRRHRTTAPGSDLKLNLGDYRLGGTGACCG